MSKKERKVEERSSPRRLRWLVALAVSVALTGLAVRWSRALSQRGRGDEAVASMTKALECDPDYILGYKNLAAVQLERGELEAAIETLQRARERAPADAELERDLAELVTFRNRNR